MKQKVEDSTYTPVLLGRQRGAAPPATGRLRDSERRDSIRRCGILTRHTLILTA